MTNELILLAGDSGYFKVRKDEHSIIGDVFNFEISATDDEHGGQVLTARIPRESADTLLRFLSNHLSRSEARGYEPHAFDPFNPDWHKPRCKICTKFEEDSIHKV